MQDDSSFELGHLPPRIHPATLDEIEARFGKNSEIRRAQMESVRWLVELAAETSVERIVLNGSFVTDIMEPNDVDCALLVLSNSSGKLSIEEAFGDGLPFLEISILPSKAFGQLINKFFATDRFSRPKGMIEVIQWN